MPEISFSLEPEIRAVFGDAEYFTSGRELARYIVRFLNREHTAQPAAAELRTFWEEARKAEGGARADEDDREKARALLMPLLINAMSEDWRKEHAGTLVSTASQLMLPIEPRLRLTSTPRGIRFSCHVPIMDVVRLYTVMVGLLMGDEALIARDLRRCELRDCRKLFLVERDTPGRPQDRYCLRHGKKAHRLGAPERMRRLRARRVLLKGHRRLGEERIQRAVEEAATEHPEVKSFRKLADYAEESLPAVRRHK